jgi:hypothetical protein
LSKQKRHFQPPFPKQETKEVEKKAAELGHKLGKWKWVNGGWCNRCRNKGCTAKVTMNRNGHSVLDGYGRRCPIGAHSI